MPQHVYLSAHLDDAVYSCGGLIHHQVQAGHDCTVLTVFAGDPPPGKLSAFAEELHTRWGTPEGPAAIRRDEDLEAVARLGAGALHFGIAEAVYRQGQEGRPLYPSEEAIFGPVHPEDRPIVSALIEALDEVGLRGSQVYVPLAIGGHIDHKILRAAAEALAEPVWYYQDLPYAMRDGELPQGLRRPLGVEAIQPLDPEDVTAWAEAAAAYRTQASTFWDDTRALRDELTAFLARQGGVRILAPLAED